MNIKVNEKEWHALNPDEQTEIRNIVAGFFKGARIVPDPDGASIPGAMVGGNPWCELACNAAQGLAEQACMRIGNSAARQACLLAAKAAGDACRAQC